MKKSVIICCLAFLLGRLSAQNLDITNPVTEGKKTYLIENSAYTLGFTGNYGIPSWSLYKFMLGMAHGTAVTKEEWKSDSRVKNYKLFAKDVSNAGTNLEPVQLFPKEHARYDSEAMESTFLTSNIVFMSRQLHEYVWDRITESFEEAAQKNGTIYIFSGPVFDKNPLKIKWILNNKVAVPTHFYRIAVYNEDGHTVCKCYRFANRIPTDYERNCDLEEFAYNIYQLEDDTGIDFFSRDMDANFRQEKLKYLEKRESLSDW